MKERKRKKKFLAVVCSMALVFFMRFGTGAALVYGASGTVYTCTIYPCYAHPVTGEIEDSGGEAGYATGQGMLEGILYGNGIMEVTDSGEYYLTIRLSMMDYTSNHSFWVQNVGDSQWSSVSAAITGNGTDTNGSNSDICIQVPSENCVVRGSMYVDPMGREVIYYFYTGDYAEGNSTDMTATIVTEASGTGTESETQTDSQSENSGSSTSSASASSGSTSSGSSVSEVVFRHIFRYRFRKDGYTAEYAGRYKEYHRKHRTDGTFAEQYSGSSFAFFRYGRGNA